MESKIWLMNQSAQGCWFNHFGWTSGSERKFTGNMTVISQAEHPAVCGSYPYAVLITNSQCSIPYVYRAINLMDAVSTYGEIMKMVLKGTHDLGWYKGKPFHAVLSNSPYSFKKLIQKVRGARKEQKCS
jgi:hypothetical protein